MPTFLWKVKSRIETFFHLSNMFGNLTASAFEALKGKDVFFVEIGANDGISHDPIYQFVIKEGWKGVYVEPQKKVFDQLVSNFKGYKNLYFENIAITENEEDLKIYVPKNEGLNHHTGIASLSPEMGVLGRFKSSDLEAQDVKGKPIGYLINKYNLKEKRNLILLIDVEGYEKNIIMGLDFSLFSPKYILFEHAHMTYDTHRYVNGYLVKNGYKIYIDKFDTLAYKP